MKHAKSRWLNLSRTLYAIVMMTLASAAWAEGHLATERIFWDKTPIKLTLRVGEERLITFDSKGPINAGIPAKLNRTALRSQIVGNTLYWLAKEPFERTRVQILDKSSGELILIDIAASEKMGSAAPVEIISAVTKVAQAPQSQAKAAKPAETGLDFVTLTRYAAQQLYAPARLLKDIPGVVRVPLDTETKIPLMRGGKVEALPLIAWNAGPHFVTAVRLRNKTDRLVVLDPRDLRGQWLASTFQHGRLLPQGDEADTTAVYLISKRPFADALL